MEVGTNLMMKCAAYIAATLGKRVAGIEMTDPEAKTCRYRLHGETEWHTYNLMNLAENIQHTTAMMREAIREKDGEKIRRHFRELLRDYHKGLPDIFDALIKYHEHQGRDKLINELFNGE